MRIKVLLGVVILFLLNAMSIPVTLAQANIVVTVKSVAVDKKVDLPYNCLNVTFSLQAPPEQVVIVAAFPLIKGKSKDNQIPNVSGDPRDMWNDGTIVSHVSVKNDKATSSNWTDIPVCVNTDHFPLLSKDSTYYVVLAFFNADNGKLIGDIYDTVDSIGMFTIPAATQKTVRITYITKTVQTNLSPRVLDIGATYRITFEAWMLKGKSIIVNMLPITKDGNYVENVDSKSTSKTRDGYILSQAVVMPNTNDFVWGDWQEDDTKKSLSFFVSFNALPKGEIYPSFVVFEEGSKVPLLTVSFINESLAVIVQ